MPITVGTVEVEIIPTTRGFKRQLQEALLPAAKEVGTEAGKAMGDNMMASLRTQVQESAAAIGKQLGEQIANRMQAEIRDALRSAVAQGGKIARGQAAKSGEQVGGEFSRTLKARVEAAVRSLPDITIGANTSEADADIRALRVQLETLSRQRIGIDVSAEDARAQIAAVETQLRQLGASSANVQVRVDTAAAIAHLEAVREEIRLATLRPWEIRLETDGAFGAKLRASVAAAQASLPEINVGANTDAAMARLSSIRAQLDTLRDARIGIDVDAGAARAQIAAVQAQLEEMTARRHDINVRVDAARAIAQLAAVRAAADALPTTMGRLQSATGSARVGLLGVVAILGALFVPPAIGVMVAGLGALYAVTLAAAAGLAGLVLVAIPGIKKITGALQAQKAAQDAAAKSGDDAAGKGAQQAIQAQQQALQMESAQQSLAQATRQAAQQRKAAAQQVVQAQQQVVDAQRQVADAQRQVIDAQQQVKDAEDGVADARRQAAQRAAAAAEHVTQALSRVAQAQKSYTSAQKDAKLAEVDLANARKSAAQQLASYQDQLAGVALSERSATLQVEQAQLDLQTTMADPKASRLQRDQAQLTYDQAVQQLKEQQQKQKELKREAADAAAAGVEGSDQVVQAHQRVADAQEKVADAAAGITDAQKEVGKARSELTQAEVDGAKQVVDAQKRVVQAQQQTVQAQQGVAQAQQQVVQAHQRVADAQEHVGEVAQQSADQITSAQRQIESAQLSAAAAAQQAAGGTDSAAEAAKKYQETLDKMNPATRATYDAVLRLKDAFKQWSDALSPAVMPLFTRMIDGLTNSLPGLTPMVRGAADAVGGLMDRASNQLHNDPFWQRWKADLAEAIPKAITGMGVAFGNVLKGMAGIADAFFPHLDGINNRMEGLTGKFANWGANLKGSPEFEGFLDRVSNMAGPLNEALKGITEALFAVSRALDPLRGPLLEFLGSLGRFIADIADRCPWLVQGIVLVVAAMWTFSGVLSVIGTIAAANPLTWILLAVAAIIAAIVLLIIHWDTVWAGIKYGAEQVGAAFVWLWREAIKPAFDAIAEAAMWLWRNALGPAFDGISLAARILAAIVLTLLIAPLLIAFNILAAAATWLWEQALGPAFQRIGSDATWLWENVLRPVFGFIEGVFRWVGDAALWLWREAFQPAVDGIVAGATWLWRNAIEPLFRFITASFRGTGDTATWLWRVAIEPAFNAIATIASWLWNYGIKPPIDSAIGAFDALGRWAGKLYDEWIKPFFDKIGSIISTTADGFEGAFKRGKEGIERVWGGIKKIAADPINWVIDFVYTGGIKKVWDAIADKVGLGKLPDATRIEGAATGGIYPGYTPGRDVGLIGVSGGEAIIRPEGTRALGSGWVHGLNAASRAGGVSGAQQYLAGRHMGNFAFGGIVGDVVGDVVGKAKDVIRGAAASTVEAMLSPLRAAVNLAPDTPDWAKAAKNMPLSLMDGIVNKIRGEDAKVYGVMSAGVLKALGWAKTQAGKAYQWGGDGNPSWDCSGFMAAIQQSILGKNPSRLWTTFDFSGTRAPAGWVQNLRAPFMIGITNSGVGHTAGTLLGTNVESRGGDGVVVGPAARGWDNAMFTDHYGFAPSLAAGGGPAPSGLLGDWIGAALAATGTPPPGSLEQWMSGMATIVGRESGGNPLAVNTTDSNALAGNASRGLAQVIPPTFQAYHQAGTSWDIFDPIANLAASINYIKGRYGNISNVQQANPYMPAKGYRAGGVVPLLFDSGGYMPPGLNLTYNGTGRPEPVLTSRQESVLAGAVRGGDGGQFTGQLVLDSGEFLGMVNGRIDQRQAAVIDRLNAGPGR